MNEDERQRHLEDAAKWARRAERWSTIAMWGSGCVLALWALGLLLGIAAWVLIFLALTGCGLAVQKLAELDLLPTEASKPEAKAEEPAQAAEREEQPRRRPRARKQPAKAVPATA